MRGFLDRRRKSSRPASRAAGAALQALLSCLRKLRRDRAGQMASALAFQTLLSLLPLLVLALVVLHSVGGLEDAGGHLRELIVDFLVPEGLIEPESGLVGPPAPGRAQEFDDARLLVAARIDRLIAQLSQVSLAGLGVAGILLFIYGAGALLRTVEDSFSLLYEADPPLPGSRLLLNATLLTLGPVALVAARLLQDRLLHGLSRVLGGWVAAPFAYIAPLVVSWVLLVLAFRVIPNTWVSWRAAAIGALVSGLAWFAFQELFGYYVGTASMTSLYGALALLPLFLLWIHWSWLIILAGVALSFIVQYLDADENWARAQILPGDPRWLLPILVHVARVSVAGATITASRLSRELRVPPRILQPYLRLLERAGYLRRRRGRGDDEVVALARTPDAIKVRDVLDLAPSARGASAGELLRELDRRDSELVSDSTLEDLVRPGGPALGAAAPGPVLTGPAAGS